MRNDEGFVVIKKYHDTRFLRDVVGEEGIEVVLCCNTHTTAKKTMKMLSKKQTNYSLIVMSKKEFKKKYPNHNTQYDGQSG